MNRFKEIIKANKKDGFETTFLMDKERLAMDRLDCFWYEDEFAIANIENDKFRIEAKVVGEIRYKVSTKLGNSVTIGNDLSYLNNYCIVSDDDLHELIDGDNPNYNIEIIDNRWIEMPIFDKENKVYITEEYDSSSIIPDTNNILECINGGMLDYINGFLYKDEEITLE